MTLVLVPVRYPLTKSSEMAVRKAVEIAQEHDGDVTVLHVNLYQNGRRVRRSQLKREVERKLGRFPRAQYLVTPGSLIEEAILDETESENADFVVLGGTGAGRFQRMRRRLFDAPDVEQYLRNRLDCQIITASVPG